MENVTQNESGLAKIKALKQKEQEKRQNEKNQRQTSEAEAEIQRVAEYNTEKQALSGLLTRKDEILKRLTEIKSQRGGIIKTGHKAVEEARQDEEVEKILHTKEGFDEVFSSEKTEWKNLQEEVSNLNEEIKSLETSIPEKEKQVNELFSQTKEGKEKAHEEKRQAIEKELLQVSYGYVDVDKFKKGTWESGNIYFDKLKRVLQQNSPEEITELLKESVLKIIDKDPRGLNEETKKLLRNFVEPQIEMTVILANTRNTFGDTVGNYNALGALETEKNSIEKEKKDIIYLSLNLPDFKKGIKDSEEKLWTNDYEIMPMSQHEAYEKAQKSWGETSRNFLSTEDRKKWTEVSKELEEHLKNEPGTLGGIFGKKKWNSRKEYLEGQIARFEDKENAEKFYKEKESLSKDLSGVEKLIREIPGYEENLLTKKFEKIGGVQNDITIGELVQKLETYIEQVKTREFSKEKQEILDIYNKAKKKFEEAQKVIIEVSKKK